MEGGRYVPVVEFLSEAGLMPFAQVAEMNRWPGLSPRPTVGLLESGLAGHEGLKAPALQISLLTARVPVRS